MKITWKNERRKVKELLPADYNPRILGEKERADLTESIERFNDVVPIVVNTGSRANVLIGGHQRVSIYADLGIEEVDVRVPDRELKADEERELNLRLNKNTGTWDWGKLKEFNMDELLRAGFGDDETSDMWDDVSIFEDQQSGEKIPKQPKTTNVKPGEVYALGQHRLMCGDATNAEDVAKLMGEAKADMVYCDPPQNKEKKSIQQYGEFLDKTLTNSLAHAKADSHVFYWCDENYICLVQAFYDLAKVKKQRVCVWIKNNFALTPGVAFNKAAEMCVYGTKGSPYLNKDIKNLNEIINREVGAGNQIAEDVLDIFNVWVQKQNHAEDYIHPNQKPTTLHEKPLKRCTAPGHIVLDLFAGSGSTLIACDQLKRICYTMENDPIFCQGVINRWQELTGQEAKKL